MHIFERIEVCLLFHFFFHVNILRHHYNSLDLSFLPFICIICQTRFREQKHLQKHYQSHHPEEEFPSKDVSKLVSFDGITTISPLSHLFLDAIPSKIELSPASKTNDQNPSDTFFTNVRHLIKIHSIEKRNSKPWDKLHGDHKMKTALGIFEFLNYYLLII